MEDHTTPCCSICTEALHSDGEFVLPECNHAFHATCIVHWFRSGQRRCPLCNNTGLGSASGGSRRAGLHGKTLFSKLRVLRRQAESKGDTSMLAEFARIAKLRRTHLSARGALRVFLRVPVREQSGEKVIDKHHKLLRKLIASMWRLRDAREALVASHPIAPIVIVTRKHVRVPMPLTAMAARRLREQQQPALGE